MQLQGYISRNNGNGSRAWYCGNHATARQYITKIVIMDKEHGTVGLMQLQGYIPRNNGSG